ncbi:hypothetical protein ACFPAF_13985 [Hymenobacter endophyticus]|uniref:VCBS repeat-containing protein n=1 Tax=Hymenobacter endophyticus TaxID=3076335 RepID=A0ABU3TJG9_9BACT|nr:hypothetical protein [Hymenobacter endophyticus]MDU0371512.1 hypothetical protein [Hymenobacter endophyticus]
MPAYFGKYLFLTALILLVLGAASDIFCQVAAQKYVPGRIAAIETDAQVLELIRPFGWEFEEVVLGDSAVLAYRPYRSTRFAVRGAQTWFKADFDHNGLPDLLVLARRKDIPFVFCVLDMGTKFQVARNFANGVRRRQPVARVVVRNGQDLLEYADFTRWRGRGGKLVDRRTSLLSFVAGGFVEYNPRPVPCHIRQLTYESFNAYHQTVRTRIAVKGDSIQFWEQRTDRYDSTQNSQAQRQKPLTPAQREQLVQLLSYINYSALRNNYGSVHVNHTNHVELTVENEHGEKKSIDDLNGYGTMGLRRLYALLHELARP